MEDCPPVTVGIGPIIGVGVGNGVVEMGLSPPPRIFAASDLSKQPTNVPRVSSIGRAKHDFVLSQVFMTNFLVISSHVPTCPAMHAIISGSHVDSAVNFVKKLLYAIASARFPLYVSSEIGVGATGGMVVGIFVMTMVVLGLIAVKLEMSITIVAMDFVGMISLVFVRVNLGVPVGAGGSEREFVLVSVNLGTVGAAVSVFNGLATVELVSSGFVGFTVSELSGDGVGSVILVSSRDSGGAGSISMKPVRLLTAVNC